MFRFASIVVLFLGDSRAFVPSTQPKRKAAHKNILAFQHSVRYQNSEPSTKLCFLLENVSDNDSEAEKEGLDSSFLFSSRRKWFTQTASSSATIASILSSRASPSFAETVTTAGIDNTIVKQASLSATNALCDPTVSILQRGSRKLYLLGTAHISAESAQVAGRLVRQVRPNAVFVELDAKRIGRLSPPKETENDGIKSDSSSIASSLSSGVASTTSNDSNVNENSVPSPQIERSIRSPTAAPPPVKTNPFNLKAKIMQAGQALIGDSIKNLYKKLESQGFSAGEEFAIAIREGLAQNATIILGDRDVDVTLRRLTEAFAKTDIKSLLSADSDFEKNMESYLPENVRASAKDLSANSDALDAATMSSFVEAMKTKDNVKNIMKELKKAAPELYEALVGERDLFMAEGMDRLAQFDSMVCVMGLAHLDGVERNLESWGWKGVNPMC